MPNKILAFIVTQLRIIDIIHLFVRFLSLPISLLDDTEFMILRWNSYQISFWINRSSYIIRLQQILNNLIVMFILFSFQVWRAQHLVLWTHRAFSDEVLLQLFLCMLKIFLRIFDSIELINVLWLRFPIFSIIGKLLVENVVEYLLILNFIAHSNEIIIRNLWICV